MISSSQNLSLLFLSDSIHGKWILCWTVSEEEGDWEFELCLAKEQENWLPLLPLTLSTKQCKSTKFSDSSGCHAVEYPRKMKTESISSIDGKALIYKTQRKCTVMWMNSSTLTTPTSWSRKHIACNTTNSTFTNCIDTQSACYCHNQDYQLTPLLIQFSTSGRSSHFHHFQLWPLARFELSLHLFQLPLIVPATRTSYCQLC